MIKQSILKEDISVCSVYMPNNRMSKYVRLQIIELQREISESTITVGDFNTPVHFSTLRNEQIQQAGNQSGHS